MSSALGNRRKAYAPKQCPCGATFTIRADELPWQFKARVHCTRQCANEANAEKRRARPTKAHKYKPGDLVTIGTQHGRVVATNTAGICVQWDHWPDDAQWVDMPNPRISPFKQKARRTPTTYTRMALCRHCGGMPWRVTGAVCACGVEAGGYPPLVCYAALMKSPAGMMLDHAPDPED